MKVYKVCAGLLLYLILAKSGLAQQPQLRSTNTAQSTQKIGTPSDPRNTPIADRERSSFRVNAHLVLLDVVVVDKDGKSVKDLKESDFQIFEDGVRQKLSSFSKTIDNSSSMVGVRSRKPSGPNIFTNFTPVEANGALTVLLVDIPGVSAAQLRHQMYLRQQLLAVLDKMPVGNPVAIFLTDPSGLRMLHGFTADPAELRKAVSAIGNIVHLSFPATSVSQAREDRQSAFVRLSQYLAGYPGRKNLVWLSAGEVPGLSRSEEGDPFSDKANFVADASGTTEVLTLNRIAVYPVDVRGLVTDSRLDASKAQVDFKQPDPVLQQMIFEHGAMSGIASATGGRAFFDKNDVGQAVDDAIKDGSSYYTISYSPSNHRWDGRFRKIRIALNTPGLHASYRKGYYANGTYLSSGQHDKETAVHPFSVREANLPGVSAPPQTPLQKAMVFGAVPSTEIVFEAKVVSSSGIEKLKKDEPMPVGNYLLPKWRDLPFRYYQIHDFISSEQLQLVAGVDNRFHRDLQFCAVVYDQEGETVNSIIFTAHVNAGPDGYRLIRENGLGIDQKIAIPAKGKFFIRLGIRDMERERIGSLEFPLAEVRLQTSASHP